VAFEPVDAALHGVPLLVDDRVEAAVPHIEDGAIVATPHAQIDG
jgi:hypothetical protein